MAKRFFGSKKIREQKIKGKKKFESDPIGVNVEVKKILGSKNLLVQRNLNVFKNSHNFLLGPNKFLHPKILGPKFGQNFVSNSFDIPVMEKCHEDK